MKDEPLPDPYLDLDEVKVGFFRNGKILYSQSNPDISMFGIEDMIGIRILKESTGGFSEDYSYLNFSKINESQIAFTLVSFSSSASKTVSNHVLEVDQTLDINDDQIWDLKWTHTNSENSSKRNFSDCMFIELNNSDNVYTTFRTMPANPKKNYPIMTVNSEDKICLDEKGISGSGQYDPGERTITINMNKLKFQVLKDDLFLLGPSFTNDMLCPLKRVEQVENTGDLLKLQLSDLSASEYSDFLKGIKYSQVYGENPDEPYLNHVRQSEEIIIWSGKINHTSQSGDSAIKVSSKEPIEIILKFMEIDFEMGLDNNLKRFFYHPIFAIRGNINVDVDSDVRQIPKTYFFNEPISVTALEFPLYGNLKFGFSTLSTGQGKIDAQVAYKLDNTYYSIRMDSTSWDSPSEWVPYADFRRNIKILSASGTYNESESSIMPCLHFDSTLSFLNILNMGQNDLRFGLKFNNHKLETKYHLDAIPSFEINTQFTVNYLNEERYTFASKPVYTVELSPYSIY